MPVLNQRQRVEFFPWQAVNQHNAPLNQRKIAEVGSGKPSNGAGWRAVNQLNQHYFCLLSEKKQRLTEREVSMTAQISAYGRLVADPETWTTGKGTSMAMARLAVSLLCNAAADGQATFWLGVIAFGKQADTLAKHQKGDLVRMAVCSKVIRLLRTVCSVPERYAQEVRQGNRVKLRMPCAVPMSNNHPLPGMKDSTRPRRMTMIFR